MPAASTTSRPPEDLRADAIQALDLEGADIDERLDRLTALCTRLFDVPDAFINLVDQRRQRTISAAVEPLPDIPLASSFCAAAVDQDAPLVVRDLADDERFADNEFVTGDAGLRFYAGHPVHAPGGQAIGTLCLLDTRPRSLDPAELALLEELAAWVEEELAADDEQGRAAAVQHGLLPTVVRADVPWDLAGACSPARKVGGDLYDWYDAPGGLIVTLADVMGKGMAAAIMMASLRAVLRAGSRHGDLEEAVQLAAESMDADFGGSGAFATLVHAHLHEDGRTVTYVDAGHGLLLLVDADGEARRLPSGGLPVGPVVPGSWIVGSVELAPGDVLVAFSDGLLDRYATVDEAFDAVRDVVRRHGDPEAVVRHLVAPPGHHRLDTDDVTAVAVRRLT